MEGLTSPINHLLLKSTMESAKRSFTRPISPKDLMPFQVIQEVAKTYNKLDIILNQLWLLYIVVVGYAGMLRCNELLGIRRKDISIYTTDHLTIFLIKCKNDQYREEHTVYLKKSEKVTCPVSITSRLISLLPDAEDLPYSIIRV